MKPFSGEEDVTTAEKALVEQIDKGFPILCLLLNQKTECTKISNGIGFCSQAMRFLKKNVWLKPFHMANGIGSISTSCEIQAITAKAA